MKYTLLSLVFLLSGSVLADRADYLLERLRTEKVFVGSNVDDLLKKLQEAANEIRKIKGSDREFDSKATLLREIVSDYIEAAILEGSDIVNKGRSLNIDEKSLEGKKMAERLHHLALQIEKILQVVNNDEILHPVAAVLFFQPKKGN